MSESGGGSLGHETEGDAEFGDRQNELEMMVKRTKTVKVDFMIVNFTNGTVNFIKVVNKKELNEPLITTIIITFYT